MGGRADNACMASRLVSLNVVPLLGITCCSGGKVTFDAALGVSALSTGPGGYKAETACALLLQGVSLKDLAQQAAALLSAEHRMTVDLSHWLSSQAKGMVRCPLEPSSPTIVHCRPRAWLVAECSRVGDCSHLLIWIPVCLPPAERHLGGHN
jgi:hypothetical protein